MPDIVTTGRLGIRSRIMHAQHDRDYRAHVGLIVNNENAGHRSDPGRTKRPHRNRRRGHTSGNQFKL
jgi:hypothetical protein